jgi:hypothetical protein
MRQLKIDRSELEVAFEGGYEMISYYLDLETGEVISVSEEARGIPETINESCYDEQAQTVDWEKACKLENVSDGQCELVREADRVEAGFGDTIIAVPSESSYEGYSDMAAFIDTLRNPHVRDRLARALSGRGALRYFKDVLLDYPAERERWFQFKRYRLQQRITEWLEGHGMTPQ